MFYSYGKDTGGISDDRKKRSDLDEKHFNLRLERDVMIDQIITLQDECKRLIKILNQDIPRVNFAEAFFDLKTIEEAPEASACSNVSEPDVADAADPTVS